MKEIIIYLVASGLALLVTFILPSGEGVNLDFTWAEAFFLISSIIFLIGFCIIAGDKHIEKTNNKSEYN